MTLTTETTDRVLVRALRRDDQQAFRLLFDRHYATLYRFVFYRLHEREQSREIVQEVFCRLWERRQNLNPDLSVRGLLFRMARNLCSDHLKKLKPVNILDLDFPSDDLLPDNKLVLQERILHILTTLPETVCETLLLHRWHGLTYREIAVVQGISVKGVEKRMSKALKILHRHTASLL